LSLSLTSVRVWPLTFLRTRFPSAAWQYGYISGKLATLRWVLGSEWDFLDT
jgi:hypothetical protein